MATAPSKTTKRKRTSLRQKMEKAGPSLARLKQLAKTSRPPQRWFDETDNPFKSEPPRK